MLQDRAPAYLFRMPLAILSRATSPSAISNYLQFPIYNTGGYISMGFAYFLVKEKSPP